jgi:hypothetical protein
MKKKDLVDLLISIEETIKTTGSVKENSVIHHAIEHAIRTLLKAKVIVFDNNGETLDRYTIFAANGAVFGMSQSGKDFNIYIGDDTEIEKGDHLGQRLNEIPDDLLFPVLHRVKFTL